MTFGEELREVRKASGIQLRELSYLTGYSKSYLMKLERGEKMPASPAKLVILLRRLTKDEECIRRLFRSAFSDRYAIQLTELDDPKKKKILDMLEAICLE